MPTAFLVVYINNYFVANNLLATTIYAFVFVVGPLFSVLKFGHQTKRVP
jgi:4-hydroxybenzoate polyprenyltransferase